MNKLNDSEEIILAASCLLLSIANADDNIDWGYLDLENDITIEQQIRNYFLNNRGNNL